MPRGKSKYTDPGEPQRESGTLSPRGLGGTATPSGTPNRNTRSRRDRKRTAVKGHGAAGLSPSEDGVGSSYPSATIISSTLDNTNSSQPQEYTSATESARAHHGDAASRFDRDLLPSKRPRLSGSESLIRAKDTTLREEAVATTEQHDGGELEAAKAPPQSTATVEARTDDHATRRLPLPPHNAHQSSVSPFVAEIDNDTTTGAGPLQGFAKDDGSAATQASEQAESTSRPDTNTSNTLEASSTSAQADSTSQSGGSSTLNNLQSSSAPSQRTTYEELPDQLLARMNVHVLARILALKAKKAIADSSIGDGGFEPTHLTFNCGKCHKSCGSDLVIECGNPSCKRKHFHRGCLSAVERKQVDVYETWVCDKCVFLICSDYYTRNPYGWSESNCPDSLSMRLALGRVALSARHSVHLLPVPAAVTQNKFGGIPASEYIQRHSGNIESHAPKPQVVINIEKSGQVWLRDARYYPNNATGAELEHMQTHGMKQQAVWKMEVVMTSTSFIFKYSARKSIFLPAKPERHFLHMICNLQDDGENTPMYGMDYDDVFTHCSIAKMAEKGQLEDKLVDARVRVNAPYQVARWLGDFLSTKDSLVFILPRVGRADDEAIEYALFCTNIAFLLGSAVVMRSAMHFLFCVHHRDPTHFADVATNTRLANKLELRRLNPARVFLLQHCPSSVPPPAPFDWSATVPTSMATIRAHCRIDLTDLRNIWTGANKEVDVKYAPQVTTPVPRGTKRQSRHGQPSLRYATY